MNTPETQVENRPKPQDEGLLSRWAKRKQAVLQEEQTILQEKQALAKQEQSAELPEAEAAALPTDKDMPPIESLTADSDFSGFMSPKVSESLRRLALSKLFHGGDFNICDGLDDYDGDYTSFAKLGNIITADMKHRIEMELRKKLETAVASGEVEPEEAETLVRQNLAEENRIGETRAEKNLNEEKIAEGILFAGEDRLEGKPVDEQVGEVFG